MNSGRGVHKVQVWGRPEFLHFSSFGPEASAAPSWPPRPGKCRGCGERSAAPLKQEAKNPRQEACLSPPPPLLHGLRLRCRRHSRSAPAAALLCPGAGDFPPDLLPLLLPEDHPSPSRPPYPQRKVRTFPGWDPLRVVSQGVCSPEDSGGTGGGHSAFSAWRGRRRRAAPRSRLRSRRPLDGFAASGFVPLASANSHQGCNWLGWLQALAFFTQNNLISGHVRKWPALLGLTRSEERQMARSCVSACGSDQLPSLPSIRPFFH